jgi:ribosomal protein S12 methylthiotransferase accessory factor
VRVDVGFPASDKIQARSKGLVVEIGLPPDRGGDPQALGPFDLLLCSLALCTGYHVLSFLQERGISIAEAGLSIQAERDEDSHLLATVLIEIRVPEDFPGKYRDAIVRAAGQCLVKAQLGQRPQFKMSVVPARRNC